MQEIFATMARGVEAVDPTLLSWAFLVMALMIICSGIDEYISDRRIVDAMRRFGESFICEFERPLMEQGDLERPIQWHLRTSARRRQLEILLAPTGARRYPNLSDHKKNVEYDVSRILQRLPNQPFVRNPLYAQGRWVVVPFQFPVSSNQAGGK
jgi:hypothetical protein